MGSVKDLQVIVKPTKDSMGIGRFHFSDRYSIFDWGEMPDYIEGKGVALCLMGAYCFEKLEEKDIKSHYRGLINERNIPAFVDELEKPTRIMEFDLVNVLRPRVLKQKGNLTYDYSMFTSNLCNCLIPLEIIYRNGLPSGSSIFRRLERGSISIEELGLNHYPRKGEKLVKPILDVSTKLEKKDRYIKWEEAQRIAGLTDGELNDIRTLLIKVDETITHVASKAGLKNEDGKIELAFDLERRPLIVDVVGTLDECRFTYNGLHVSKEMARRFYRKTTWYRDIEEAKRDAGKEGIEDWKQQCESNPPKLDQALKEILSKIYLAAANEFIGRRFFDVPSLSEVVKEYRNCMITV